MYKMKTTYLLSNGWWYSKPLLTVHNHLLANFDFLWEWWPSFSSQLILNQAALILWSFQALLLTRIRGNYRSSSFKLLCKGHSSSVVNFRSAVLDNTSVSRCLLLFFLVLCMCINDHFGNFYAVREGVVFSGSLFLDNLSPLCISSISLFVISGNICPCPPCDIGGHAFPLNLSTFCERQQKAKNWFRNPKLSFKLSAFPFEPPFGNIDIKLQIPSHFRLSGVLWV